MAIEKVISTVVLDVYDHDTTPTTIKTIALDNKTRVIRAYLQKEENPYEPDPGATVELIALRPDKVGAISSGTVVELPTPNDGVGTVFGLQAEIVAAQIAIKGTVRFQFRITRGEDVLRTEILEANNGEALDAETTDWAGEYQGYNLDELAEKVDLIAAAIDGLEPGDTSIDDAVTSMQLYIDNKIGSLIRVQNNILFITTE